MSLLVRVGGLPVLPAAVNDGKRRQTHVTLEGAQVDYDTSPTGPLLATLRLPKPQSTKLVVFRDARPKPRYYRILTAGDVYVCADCEDLADPFDV